MSNGLDLLHVFFFLIGSVLALAKCLENLASSLTLNLFLLILLTDI